MHPDAQRRRGGFRRPSINIELVRGDQSSPTDPFQISQCQKLSEQFELLVKLGEGSSAVVYRAIDRRDKHEVALKITRTDDEERVQRARDEFRLLQRIKHANIIKVLDFFTYARGAVLVQEFFDGEDLEKVITQSKDGCIVEANASRLFTQLLDAVAYLHRQGIIHRDIKAQNLLISHSLIDLRLLDFNVSKLLADGAALTMTGTRQYMPPEVLKGTSPSEASDIWACGLCFHYMLIGNLPKHAGTQVELEGSKWELLSEQCRDIVRKCLEPRQELRPNASEVIPDSWLEGKSPTNLQPLTFQF
jgi:cell division control protein CDC15